MFIARWSIEARFGHKAEVLAQMHHWLQEIGSQIGWSEDRVRLLTGSIGARESTIQSEITVGSLAELEAAWAKLATLDAHAAWSRQLEPHVVSGTQHWEIFRLLS
ncbi:hypothetical protein [Vogesella sp. LIG4]|uniref:hypothetical protein n=1 Tax=Vogesella sp. LIG4 TaxID=1192162 RepID=UPI00081FBC38|nr:hypothetical protein [Vogesella sp. LIG4]SCK12611.1 hypothetical protein PSELUDRAFT_1141 [Vogesella sp. LIG4]